MAEEWNGQERRAGWSDNPNQLLTTEQVAELLRVKPDTLVKSRGGKAGVRIRHTKVGRRVFYRKSEIDRFLDENTFNNTAEAHHA